MLTLFDQNFLLILNCERLHQLLKSIFIGWNYTSKLGDKVGTGAYVALFSYRVRVKSKVVESNSLAQTWGLLRKD